MRDHFAVFPLLLSIIWMAAPGSVRAQNPFGECAVDGVSNASVVIRDSAIMMRDDGVISFGSTIAAFAPDGSCVGRGIWNGTTQAFAVWGADPLAPEGTGLKLGDRLKFRIWDPETGQEHRTSVELENGLFRAQSADEFRPDAVYILRSLHTLADMTREGQPQDLQIHLSENYPNPFGGATTIPFNVSSPGPVVLEVFNTAGARVASLIDGDVLSGPQEIRWAPKNLSAGLYIVRLKIGDTIRTGSLIHVD